MHAACVAQVLRVLDCEITTAEIQSPDCTRKVAHQANRQPLAARRVLEELDTSGDGRVRLAGANLKAGIQHKHLQVSYKEFLTWLGIGGSLARALSKREVDCSQLSFIPRRC